MIPSVEEITKHTDTIIEEVTVFEHGASRFRGSTSGGSESEFLVAADLCAEHGLPYAESLLRTMAALHAKIEPSKREHEAYVAEHGIPERRSLKLLP